MATKKQYNYCLDFIKGIACIFVVFMHCEFPGIMGIAVQAVSRFCVPFFFMVSGYFCYRTGGGILSVSEYRCKILHIGRITLYASLFYLGLYLLRGIHSGSVSLSVNSGQVIGWLFFNRPVWVVGQMWFLFALLYTYLYFFSFELSGHRKWAYVVGFLMFPAYILLAQGLHVVGIHVPNCIYRNWAVEGFAFFMLGHWIHSKEHKIEISNTALGWIFAVSTLLCLLERYILGRDFGVNICSIPQVTALFIYAVKNPSKHQGYVQLIGKNCSMFIYILHPAVWNVMKMVYKAVHIDENIPALYMMPILVLVITVVISIICNSVKLKLSKSNINA